MEQWWNDTDRGKLKYWYSNLSNSEGVTSSLDLLRVRGFCTRQELVADRLLLSVTDAKNPWMFISPPHIRL